MKPVIYLVACILVIPLWSKEIAITFDDAPRPDSAVFTSQERNQLLLSKLKQHKVQAMFFITTKHLENSRQIRLKEYQAGGHTIANHSHQHRSANQLNAKTYLADISKAHNQLKTSPHYLPYFRFPMLHEGNTQDKRDAIRQGLQKLKLQHGYVTVDNYDWYLDHLLQQSKKQNATLDLTAWRNFYLDHLMNSINFYDRLAVKHLKRSPRHVLLLHENDLAALFIDDLLQELKAQGWTIITSQKAYQDPIAQRLPETLFNGQGRVAALAAELGIPYSNLVQTTEDESYLTQKAKELKLIQ